MIPFLGLVAQLAIAAHGPDAANACQPFDLTVAVQAPGAVVPQITAPSLAPFDILRSSPSPQVSVVSGSPGRVMAEFRYVLTTDQTGTFIIPPFEARLGQTVVKSRPVSITVRGPRAENLPNIVTRARVDTGLDVNFRAIVSPETVFVGQQVNYEVAVFLNENVRDRLRRNPTFYPPDIQSMLAYDLPVHGAPPRRRVGSRCFDALVYQRALFPLVAGRFVIPPSDLVYALSTSAGFFSREESHELHTETALVVAVDPPVDSRPEDWTGAVGDIHLRARLDTNSGRVGDPLLLTVQVAGAGNVKLFPRPDVHVSWASVVRGDERVHVDSSSSKISGSKEFDWVLTPRVPGELDLPPIRYSYFNPDLRRYMEAEATPPHVRVEQGSLARADTARVDEALSIRSRYTGPVNLPLHEHATFWLLIAMAPIPALVFKSRERRRKVVATEPASERLRKLALPAAAATATPVAIRRSFAETLGGRLGLPPTVFTRPGALARALRRSGVSREIAEQCEALMRQLDGAAYSRDGTLPADAAERALALYRQADLEALPHEEIRLPLSALGLLLVAALGTGVLNAADDRSPATVFQNGVTAYAKHDYVTARDAFHDAARSEPRAADAWANYGTASWAAGDTARAVAGWQRALRLEPLAADMRDRVEMAHGLPIGSAGYVPPTPLSLVAAVGFLLWAGGWGLTALWSARGRRAGGGNTALVITGGIGLVATFGLAAQLSGHQVAVVRGTNQLQSQPVLGSERAASVLSGEVVRVKGQRGAWTLIGLDDGRDGWIDSSALISLDPQDSALD